MAGSNGKWGAQHPEDGESWVDGVYGALTQQSQTSSEREQSLADENARLKRLLAEQAEELAIVKKAAAYFAKSLK